MNRNLTDWRRVVPAVAAGALTWWVWRSLSRRPRRLDDTREALGGSSGILVRERIVIHAPVESLYRFWQNPANLPRVMPYLERVDPIDATRSHWIVAGPAGKSLEWDAEVINQVPLQTIGWQSLPGADVASAGSVNFREIHPGVTEVIVRMQYEPPAGKVGASIARVFGASVTDRVRQALAQFKQAMEGETAARWSAVAP